MHCKHPTISKPTSNETLEFEKIQPNLTPKAVETKQSYGTLDLTTV